jgi:hypothetical protein
LITELHCRLSTKFCCVATRGAPTPQPLLVIGRRK